MMVSIRKYILSLASLLSGILLSAQTDEVRTQYGRLTGQDKFPVLSYMELEPHEIPDAEEWKGVEGVQVSWGGIDVRYSKTSVPMASVKDKITLSGWRGERVFAQAVVWTGVQVEELNYEVTDLKGPHKSLISSDFIKTGYVRYVLGDGYFSNGTGCGEWAKEPSRDSVLVADCIDHLLDTMILKPMQTQGIWFTCQIPSGVEPGLYTGDVIVRNGDKVIRKLKLSIQAREEILPDPEDWHFHLDLWQNPYAVARYHQVEPWSDEHMEAMRPLMTLLAKAGQKVITTTLIHKPWGGQTEDYFESMVTWIKKVDGTWEYKFDIFDKWVEFMMDCGVTEQINCFSIAPWSSSFQYYDQASNSFKFVNADVGTPEYEAFWSGMLVEFARHLREKGWFDICTIAMDERPVEVMLEVIRIIRSVEPDFKIALAGGYHPEIESEIYDYCLAYSLEFPEDVLERRRKEGKISTYYTCCTEIEPNLFTISDPQDGLFLGLDMARRKSDGYLRWAYNSWPLEPLMDSRFRAFTSGDTFMVYPGGRSSIRMERLVQGIQEYEKIRILGQEKTPDVQIIPEPAVMQVSSEVMNVRGASYFVGEEVDERSSAAICGFMSHLGHVSASSCSRTNNESQAVFTYNINKELNDEVYFIKVKGAQIKIEASSFNGFLYAIETLKQLLPIAIYGDAVDRKSSWTIPHVIIEDYPRFGYRGMHMDSARHFWSVAQVKKYLDIMAVHKMNTFHWHLTDDQGWRVEIKKYPKLTEIGSKRSGTALGKGWYDVEYDGIPYGGFYTREDIREIVEYASSKGITVIPEIDLPGHMLAAIASYPHLGCTGKQYEVWGRWGVSPEVLCAGRETTYEFLENVLLEIMELFPSKYIHIGGDECPKVRWKECPACQTKMKELGLDGENAAELLQGYVTRRIETFLAGHGRSIIGWDEILSGDISSTATIMSWRGVDGGIAAAKAGHDAIMTPNTHCYLDYYQSRKIQDEPFAIGGFVDVAKVYSFEPHTAEMTEEQKNHILGVQANLWTEYIKTPEHQEYMLLPRMTALSEVQWSYPHRKDYDRFLDKMSHMVEIYKAMGFNFAKHIFEVIPVIGVNEQAGRPEVTLTTQGTAPMYYTLDGSLPTASSTLYTGPVTVGEGEVFKAIVDRKDMETKVLTQTFSDHKAMGKSIRMNTVPSPLHSAGLPESLVNGVLNEDQDAAAGEWVAWRGEPVEVVIDMNGETYSRVSVRTFVSKWEDMYAPLGLCAYVSEDGETFTEVASEEYEIEEEKVPDGIKLYDLEFTPVSSRYLKVVVKTVPALPAWSERPGKPAYLFLDEIKVE